MKIEIGLEQQFVMVFLLLVIFQLKHFLADFPFQTQYMLKKTLAEWAFVIPLGVHCSIHAAMTFGIMLYFAPHLWWLALCDFAIHFIMDRIKSGPKYLGRFNNPSRTSFWVSLGFDQMVHHLTHIWIIWYMLTHPVI